MILIKKLKKIFVLILGLTILIFGLALLVLPGPGLIIIIAGLAVLAIEFIWAKKLLEKLKEKTKGIKERVLKTT